MACPEHVDDLSDSEGRLPVRPRGGAKAWRRDSDSDGDGEDGGGEDHAGLLNK